MPQQNIAANATTEGYHPITRWLHAGLVLGVLFQISAASMMSHPEHQHGAAKHGETVHGAKPASHNEAPLMRDHVEHAHEEVHEQPATGMKHDNSSFGATLMTAHRGVGIAVVFVVFANLFWACLRRGQPKKRQIGVLLSTQAWSEAFQVAKNLPRMLLGKQTLTPPGNGLALMVEMLGLLTMTAMASTGFIIWYLWAGLGSAVVPTAETLMQLHANIATLLYLYLIGHVGMALLHARSGDNVFARIVPTWGKKRGASSSTEV